MDVTKETESRSIAFPKFSGDRQWLNYLLPALIVLIVLTITLSRFAPEPISSRFSTFTTIFLAIFIEAAPFLVLGSIVSGVLEIFVSRQTIVGLVPRQPVLAAFVGSLLGFAFPVCECGVVPVTRRLYRKGLPPSVGIAFLLAAPVVNPIVMLSTYAAFGWGPVLIGRLVFSILIAFIVGMTFSGARSQDVLLDGVLADGHEHSHVNDDDPLFKRIWIALSIGGDDFLDMGRYLIMGSALAAGMQTFIPQDALLSVGSGAVLSVIVLMVLAFILSVCSTVDAFLALSFVNTFTTGSILAFLVFGPMVDIKSSLMFLRVFKKSTVARLIALPLVATLIIGLMINFYF